MTSGGREEGQIDNDGQKEKVLAKAELWVLRKWRLEYPAAREGTTPALPMGDEQGLCLFASPY